MCQNKSVSHRIRGFALNNRAIARWLGAGWTSENEVFENMEQVDLKVLMTTMQLTFDAIVTDLRAAIAAFEQLDDSPEDLVTDSQQLSNQRASNTIEQLENCVMLIEKDLFKSKSRERDQLTSKKLKDFGLKNVDSIVPLMNMAEVYLLKPGDEVIDGFIQDAVLFLTSIVLELAKQTEQTVAGFRAIVQLLEASIRVQEVLELLTKAKSNKAV